MNLVLDPLNEVILAYEMNGEELSLDHGYPLRLVTPGIVGIRCAKWISKIEISDEEANSYEHKEFYKIIKERDPSKVDISKISPIFEMNINSAISYPGDK